MFGKQGHLPTARSVVVELAQPVRVVSVGIELNVRYLEDCCLLLRCHGCRVCFDPLEHTTRLGAIVQVPRGSHLAFAQMQLQTQHLVANIQTTLYSALPLKCLHVWTNADSTEIHLYVCMYAHTKGCTVSCQR